MKKILLTLSLALIGFAVQAEVLSTNVTAGGVHLLSTNRASVYNIQITSGNSVMVTAFDCDSVAAPFLGTNYTNAAFYSKTTYTTNIASSYIGANGVTNWITNSGIYTLSVSNAPNTNALPAMGSWVVAGNTYMTADTDMLFTRGIVLRTTTNASVVITYRPAGQ